MIGAHTHITTHRAYTHKHTYTTKNQLSFIDGVIILQCHDHQLVGKDHQ